MRKSGITASEAIIIGILFFALLPVLPVNIVFIVWAIRKDVKENYIFFPSIFALAILCAVLYNYVELFFIEAGTVVKQMIYGIMAHKLSLSVYQTYSVSSWIMLLLLSLIFSCLVVKVARKVNRLAELGITSMEGSISKIGARRHEYSDGQGQNPYRIYEV